MSTRTKYIVWINEGNGWEDCGEGPLTLKQAERISREIRQDCGCKAKFLPDGDRPINKIPWATWMMSRQ